MADPILARQVAEALIGRPDLSRLPVTRAEGVVTAFSGGLVTVDLNAAGEVDVPRLDSYQPRVGDVVLVDVVAGDLIAIGRRANAQTDWVPLDLINGWGIANGTPSVRLIGDRVEFCGRLTGASATDPTICLLESTFHPSTPRLMATVQGTSASLEPTRVQVSATGEVSVSGPSPAGFGPLLDGLFYTL